MTSEVQRRSQATIYGYPRQGRDRALKRTTEAYWRNKIDSDELAQSCREIRLQRLTELREAGVGEIPSNDFSLYDHVLDTIVLFGAEPQRYRSIVSDHVEGNLDRYFAMARGTAELAPLEMTKWFNTNYHYLVPEIGPTTTFSLNTAKIEREFAEAKELGVLTRPVVVGPVSFLLLAKAELDAPEGFRPIDLLEPLVAKYGQLLSRLSELGAEWVQLDEPALVLDQPKEILELVASAYDTLASVRPRPKILVASYFDRLGEALPVLANSAVEGLAMDFTGSAARNLDELVALGGIGSKRLVAGVVDGHNIWTSDLTRALNTLETLVGLADEVDVSASCSLLHVPLDVRDEHRLDPAVLPWLAFAHQKLDEIVVLARGLREGRDAINNELVMNQAALSSRATSPLVRDATVRDKTARVGEKELHRHSPYAARQAIQEKLLSLPVLPTTTIGSFPQTAELRRTRSSYLTKKIDLEEYETAMRTEIQRVIEEQEALGIDVLVHGEPERNDMVQYFAEQLNGYIATDNGWVQSYGSRYVRPPIILGDVSRPEPMTVRWTQYAQSLTAKPVKGMLTGPVTMLAWSFVRDDLDRSEVAAQVALALRDEVVDLEASGAKVIQVDEPALRETLPLRKDEQGKYLEWASRSFRLASSGVRDETQIHTHMCYAEFGDVLPTIIDLDADVISLEAARSQMAIVGELADAGYPNEVGPGVWDIHSPRVPSVDEIVASLRNAIALFPLERLWVNPDCGLKTRGGPEVAASLANLVEATDIARKLAASK